MLRHTLATLAYRAGKALGGVSADFGAFRAAPGTRTPVEIVAHMGDLMDWAARLADGRHEWRASVPMAWDLEAARFFAALRTLDERIATGVPLGFPAERIFQGPVADALTHVGQIAMLRRMMGEPLPGENYFRAEIEVRRI